LAEHLMFSREDGTKEDNYEKLSFLEANTSHKYIQLSCVFSLEDFDEVIKEIKSLFDWDSSEGFFYKEKVDILEEVKKFIKSTKNKEVSAIASLFDFETRNAIGTVKSIKSLTASDLPRVKAFWKRLIDSADVKVMVLGDGISEEQVMSLEKTFARQVSQDKTEDFKITSAAFVESKKAMGWVLKSPVSYIGIDLLADIFDARIFDAGIKTSVRLINLSDSFVIGFPFVKIISKKKIVREAFLTPVSKEEFETVKDNLLKVIKEVQQESMVDSLDFLRKYYQSDYVDLENLNFDTLVKIVNDLDFDQFSTKIPIV